MTQKIIFLKWLPASWKSTWARQYILDNPNTVRVNKDDIRNLLHWGVFSKENEVEVLDYQKNQVATWLAKGKSVIIDNTHLFWTHEKEYKELANMYDVEFEIKSFLDVPVKVCVTRDMDRWAMGLPKVWANVIMSMAKKAWLSTGEQEFAVVPMQKHLPRAIIVDIDGTVALNTGGRSPYDGTRVLEDTPNERVLDVILSYLNWYWEIRSCLSPAVIFVSWREETCRKDTETWLNKNIPFSFLRLLMRKEGDKRKDSIIKYEILLDLAKEFNIIASFDDRDQVCKMWREAWLLCLQVDNGNF